MVYRGKPSLACSSCRTRRIKCDQLRPECTQCANIGAKCPGYRNALDLMFRDETLSIRKKATSKIKKPKKNWTPQTPPGERLAGGSDLYPFSSDTDPRNSSPSNAFVASPPHLRGDATAPLPNPVGISIDELAISFFLGTYVFNSRFDYVPMLWGTHMREDTPIYHSIKASAFASLAQELQSGVIASIGRKHYGRALTLTNAALASKTAAIRNDTLGSVLVLALFDTITQTDQISRTSWEAHVNGATALLKLRGHEQFNTKVGRKLFLHAADTIRIRCFQNSLPIPEYILTLDNNTLARMDGMLSDLSPLVNRMANVRALVMKKKDTDPYGLIEQVHDFQKEIPRIKAQVPRAARYRIFQVTSSGPTFFGDTYHICDSHRHLRHWNTLRMLQIWISEVLALIIPYAASQAAVQPPPGFSLDLEAVAKTAVDRMLSAAEEIFATVPQTLGYVKPPSGVLGLSYASRLSLIWPLSLVGQSLLVPPDMARYAVEQLFQLGERYKLPQATRMANSIAKARTDDMWVHMCHTS